MKQATLSLKVLSTFLLLCGMNLVSCVWSMEKGSYDIGENWETGSLDSRGFTGDPTATGRSGFKETHLEDLPEIRKYMFKGSLEITPENYEGLLQFSDLYGTAFGSYDRGVFVKRWKSSLGTDVLLDLLLKFTHINKFKIEVVWDSGDVDMSEIIARSVQFFGDLGELTISKCQLTDSGLEDILESLKTPDILKILDIRENRLSDSVLPKIRERLIRLIDLKTDLVQTESKIFPFVKESDSDRISEELRTERLKREVAEQRAVELEQQRNEAAQREEEQERARKAAAAQTISVSTAVVKRPMSTPVPDIARGYEDVYLRFIRGKLIYKTGGFFIKTIEIPILSLSNPLEGTFDLSRCGDVGKYLSISTGYRKSKISTNNYKVEVWIVPKFIMEQSLGTSANHFDDIISKWTSPFGMFWNNGSDDLYHYRYVIDTPFDVIFSNSLFSLVSDAQESPCGHGSMKAYYPASSYNAPGAPAALSSILIKF